MRFHAARYLGVAMLGSLVASGVMAQGLPDGRAEVRVLFVGNSLTAYNDLAATVAKLHEQVVPGERMTAVRVTPGGYRLAQHAVDARARGRALSRRLVEAAGWDYVVLQEQGRGAALDPDSAETRESLAAAAELADAARASGAKVIFFMPWAYLRGDPTNPPATDYVAMQDRIATNCARLVARATPEEARRRLESRRRADELRGEPPRPLVDPDIPLLAPVGLAFRRLHDDELAAGHDPLAADSPFVALYDADGGHPSVAGSYLAACVICATISGRPIADARHVPLGLDPDVAAQLRQAADEAAR